MSIIPDPNQKRKSKKPDFSLTTVNIVLLLIFFFLITGTLTETDELRIDLSQTEDLPLDRLPKPLLLVMPDGKLVYENQTLDREAAAAAISASPQVEANLNSIHVLADKNLGADQLISLIQDPVFEAYGMKLVTLHQRNSVK